MHNFFVKKNNNNTFLTATIYKHQQNVWDYLTFEIQSISKRITRLEILL